MHSVQLMLIYLGNRGPALPQLDLSRPSSHLQLVQGLTLTLSFLPHSLSVALGQPNSKEARDKVHISWACLPMDLVPPPVGLPAGTSHVLCH